MVSRKVVYKPLLGPVHKMKRKAFATKFRNWTAADWKNVIFSDEKMWRMRPGGRIRCWRPKGASKYLARYTIPAVAKSEGVMIWAAMNGNGDIIVRRCPKKINSMEYQRILQNSLQFIRHRYCVWNHHTNTNEPLYALQVNTLQVPT